MLERLGNSTNTNILSDETRINSSSFVQRPSFKGNPNAVDNTPGSDTYTPTDPLPKEMSFGEKFIKYIIPTWMGLHFGTQAFDKVNGGEYEKSLVGRLGKWGDKLSQTKLVRNSFVDNVRSSARTIKNNIKNFIMRHETTRTMYETPTAPESSMVTNFMETQADADLKEAAGKIGEYVNKNPKTLKAVGATKAEIDALKSTYGTNMFGRIKNEQAAVKEFLLRKLGADMGHPDIMATIGRGEANLARQIQNYRAMLSTPGLTPDQVASLNNRINRLSNLSSSYRDNVLKNLKLRALGLNKTGLEVITKDPTLHGDVIERVLGRSTRYVPKMSETYNKVKSISAPASKLGKLFPKLAKLGMRALTFGGGLWNSLFIAFFLSEAVKNTVDAPKEKKTSTAISGLTEAMAWVVSMPLSIKAMHAVNGLKNLGKSKAEVDAFKTALKTFNETTFKSKGQYDKALANLMTLKNAGVKPKGVKGLVSKVAKFLSIGLEQIKPYTHDASKLKGSKKIAAKLFNMKKGMPNFLRNCVGYPLRFALYMFAFAPIVDKVLSGVTHAIFGKPYDPEKVKEEYEKNKYKNQHFKFVHTNVPPNPHAVDGLKNVVEEDLSDKNLIKQDLDKKGLLNKNRKADNNYKSTQWDSINGVSVNTVTDKPLYMPPENQANGANGYGPAGMNGKDPSKSDYDTVPRHYVPKLGVDVNANPAQWKQELAYDDPFNDPNNEFSYAKRDYVMNSSNKTMQDINDYFSGKKD